jgi:hypothetical protein
MHSVAPGATLSSLCARPSCVFRSNGGTIGPPAGTREEMQCRGKSASICANTASLTRPRRPRLRGAGKDDGVTRLEWSGVD